MASHIVDGVKQTEENILKTMLILQMEQGNAYVSDIAKVIGLNLTTTYSAVARAVKNGYIQPLDPRRGGRVSNKQPLLFTPQGETLAKKILSRHDTIRSWLLRLGATPEEAENEACSMEHGITDHTMELLKGHVALATQLLGNVSCAPDVMRNLAEKMKEFSQNDPKDDITMNDKVRDTVERAGGIAGIERMGGLILRAGGEKQLSELLSMVESYGGFQQMKQDLEEVRELQRTLKLRGGMTGLTKIFDSVDALGGVNKLQSLVELKEDNCDLSKYRQLAELEKDLGGVKHIRQLAELESEIGGMNGLRRLKSLAEHYGGVEQMYEMMEKLRHIWGDYFRKQKKNGSKTDSGDKFDET